MLFIFWVRSEIANQIKFNTSQSSSSVLTIGINFCCFKSNFLLSCDISWNFSTLTFSMVLIAWLIFSSISLLAANRILFSFALNSEMLAHFKHLLLHPLLCQEFLRKSSLQTFFNCFINGLGRCLAICEMFCFICSSFS